jgi:hypothetical protein
MPEVALSRPSEWLEALLPLKREAGDLNQLVTISEWATFANKKAMLANAGTAGCVYKDWKTILLSKSGNFWHCIFFRDLAHHRRLRLSSYPNTKILLMVLICAARS